MKESAAVTTFRSTLSTQDPMSIRANCPVILMRLEAIQDIQDTRLSRDTDSDPLLFSVTLRASDVSFASEKCSNNKRNQCVLSNA